MPLEQKPGSKWIRDRQVPPTGFVRMRTKRLDSHELIIGVRPNGKTEVQSILHPTSEGLAHVRASRHRRELMMKSRTSVRAHPRRGTRGVRRHLRKSRRGRLANFGSKRAAPFGSARRRSAPRADTEALYVMYQEARRTASARPTAANLAEERRLHARYSAALEGRRD
jgi:hypothetical protein